MDRSDIYWRKPKKARVTSSKVEEAWWYANPTHIEIHRGSGPGAIVITRRQLANYLAKAKP